MSNRVVVRICGEEFALFTDDSIEYTQSVGNHVNSEMQKCLSAKMGRMNAAIMAALNIADELFKVRETDEQLRVQIKSALDEAARVKAEVNALKRESLSLQKKLEKAEKAQLKAEKSLLKAQKAAPKASRAKTDDAASEDAPVLLDEAAMAEIVEKSKRPRRTTRKAKAEETSVEVTEVVEAEAAPETTPEAVETAPVAEEPVPEAAPEAVAEETTPEAAEAAPEAVEEPTEAVEAS